MSHQKAQTKRRNDMPIWDMEDREEPPIRPGFAAQIRNDDDEDDVPRGHILDHRRASKAIPTILRRIDYLRDRIDQNMKMTGRRLSWDEQELRSAYFLIGIARDVGYTIGNESGNSPRGHVLDHRRARKAIPTMLKRIDHLRNRIDQQMKMTGSRLSHDEQELQSLYFLIGIARDVGYTIEIGEESGR
jgi:hypothetical protein